MELWQLITGQSPVVNLAAVHKAFGLLSASKGGAYEPDRLPRDVCMEMTHGYKVNYDE